MRIIVAVAGVTGYQIYTFIIRGPRLGGELKRTYFVGLVFAGRNPFDEIRRTSCERISSEPTTTPRAWYGIRSELPTKFVANSSTVQVVTGHLSRLLRFEIAKIPAMGFAFFHSSGWPATPWRILRRPWGWYNKPLPWPLAKINPFMLAGIDPLVAQRMTGWEKGENRLPEPARDELARA